MPLSTETVNDHQPAGATSNTAALSRTIGVLFAIVGVLLAVDSLRLIVTYQPVVLQRPVTTLLDVLATQRPRALGSIYMGLAARKLSGGPVVEIVGPRSLGLLAKQDVDKPSEINIDPYNPHFLKQIAGDHYARLDYDPVLTDAEVNALLSEYTTERYPMKLVMVGVQPGGRRERLIMFTDPRQSATYIVPESLVPQGRLP